MPVNMKPKTTTTCKKDGSYPHVCQTSIKIFKQPCPMVRSDAKEKENLAISCQSSLNDFLKNEESCKDHDNKGDMGMPHLPFNGCTYSEIAIDCFPSVSSGSEIMWPVYNDELNYSHCHLSEGVNWENLNWALDMDDNPLTTCQMPNVLDSNAHETKQSGCPNIIEDTEGHRYVNLSALVLPGTKETTPIMVEETTGTENYHDYGGFQLEQICDSSWFDLLCHQATPFPENIHINSTQLDSGRVDFFDQEAFFLKNCFDLSETSDGILPALISQETVRKKDVTLVLDLDETLIHSSIGQCNDADFTFEMYTEKKSTVYVRKRPFLQEFLEKVSEMFKIIIFTASKRVYAEKLLDVLDPHNKFFSRRVYRESCTWIDNRCVKDLTILGVDLEKVFIIDNSPEVFRFQVNNGIPIKSWFDDPTDSALISLLPFLEKLVDVDDVRPIIAQKYGASY
ncbi:CTD small phosphatase-like protein 2 isoform X1 [Cajanus cajan]|uniref:CTD small phosphatase-like protein 2 isoform X1 n=1 Tax=Cajanus cajan TaxID=3821 RepID=UPI00098D8D5C|nr:CTD small phosphatase-like protein 2 isoform X1 [Cajanus cajan]XP_020224856.1 CTD small phosphatase-like protein 2 isoform X1 [Cajanus cajan]XP_020224859.1 CTD small phosphatase-like protein 2 isoform X1 [Cajanus cajan]